MKKLFSVLLLAGAALAPFAAQFLFSAFFGAFVMAQASPSQEDAARTLTVSAYNIHHGAGTDEKLDLERIAVEIERGGAKIIGLQEVDRHWGERSEFADQAAWLGKRLGMEVVYGANLDEDPETEGAQRRQYGTTILSAYPITSSRNTLLPRPEEGEQRGLLEAHITVDGIPVHFATTHLQHTSAAERLAQTKKIVKLLSRVKEPIVLVGDLNAQPGTPELKPLSPRFLDAWPRAGEGEGFTAPSGELAYRIDYVLTTPDILVVGARVLDSPASDHAQVVVDVVLPSTSAGKQKAQ